MLGQAAAHKLGGGPNLDPLFDYSKATTQKANIFGKSTYLGVKYIWLANILSGPNLVPHFDNSKSITKEANIFWGLVKKYI